MSIFSTPPQRRQIIETADRIDDAVKESSSKAWTMVASTAVQWPKEPVFLLQEFYCYVQLAAKLHNKSYICPMFRLNVDVLEQQHTDQIPVMYPITTFTARHAAMFPPLVEFCRAQRELEMARQLEALGKLPIPAEERGQIVAFRPKKALPSAKPGTPKPEGS